MATSLHPAPFDARGKRRRDGNQWPLGLSVFVMVVANAVLWTSIYAITHGLLAVDQRFFAGF
ncbi:hypothetical protein [Caulobacter sp.]|uniref:hypothetical protein n=1 Tax=Caulobacter sp. TaxID=78 RepID=UPI003BADAA6C